VPPEREENLRRFLSVQPALVSALNLWWAAQDRRRRVVKWLGACLIGADLLGRERRDFDQLHSRITQCWSISDDAERRDAVTGILSVTPMNLLRKMQAVKTVPERCRALFDKVLAGRQ
jgi:hypothetical protein